MKRILKKKNIKYYLIFYAVIELISKFSLIRGILAYIYSFFEIAFKSPNLETFVKSVVILVVMMILWMLIFVFMTLPVTIVLLARKTADSTQERQNRKYTSRENIIYYREKLKGISPTTISLMKNLKVEEEKDLVATIMKLRLNGNILIEEHTIKILSNDVSNLMPNEEIILQALEEGKIRKSQIEYWKNTALAEAKSQGYIKDKNSSTGLAIKKVVLIALFVLFILGFKHFGSTFESLVDEVEKMGITEQMEIFEIVEHEESRFILDVLFQGLILMVCIVGIFAWPIFYIVYIVRYQNKNNSLRRTIKGEKLTDEILGMKRFIHDFSMLNEVDKEAIELWDDFLVYAIVLGENNKIVEDILKLKNIKISDIKINISTLT